MRRILASLVVALLLLAGTSHGRAQQEGKAYVDRVVAFTPGDPANAELGDPAAALGPPDFSETALTGFVSLGTGGSITVEFLDNLAYDGPGDDIELFGDPANDELWEAEVSSDGAEYRSFGLVSERVRLDLAKVGLKSARFVRLTDDGVGGTGISPGAELDAIETLQTEPSEASASTMPAVPTSPPASTLGPPAATTNSPRSLADLEWVRLGGPAGGLG